MLKKGSFLRELPIIVVSALIVSIVVKTFLLHFFYIPSGSMENTLQVGDRIAVNKFGALFSEIKRGEVVVFGDPDNWLGQSSESANSGPIEITEPYIYQGDTPSDTKFNIDVPKGFLWVMGDHRAASADSRYHPDSANNGMVPLSKVVGRATFVVWPFGNISLIEKGEDLKKIPVKSIP
jgi:signal peptidase I